MADFNELTRVQIPAAVHLQRLGYDYLPHNGAIIRERDLDTNILVSIFKKQFLKLNPGANETIFENEIQNIILELNQDDLGRSFFNRLQGQGDYQIVDWEIPENNTYHFSLEVISQNGNDEFRPDIVIFINGLPLSYIEVKQPNAIRDGKSGIQSELDRTQSRFENKKFRRFNNITQFISFSDNLPYDSQGQQMQGSYYCSNSYSKTKFNTFKEERKTELHAKLTPLNEDMIDLVLRDMNRLALKVQPEFKTNIQPDTPCNSFLTSLYSRERIMFMLRFGLVYVEEKSKDSSINFQKHMMRYPQYFATKAIEDSILRGVKKGVIWHTQGSGKTALAFFNIRYLKHYYSKQGIVPQFYFVVDRLDLAQQSFEEFSKRGLKVKRINSKKELGAPQDTYDVAVVNIQKFEEESDLTDQSGYDLNRQNIYFIDEAHRSYNEKGSYLPNLYNADKNAINIALTGTPLITYKRGGETKESHATTKDIFGDYIHKYYYNQSIADGFTLRLMREDIETGYKENLRSIYDEIQKGSLKKEAIFAHPNYVSPMLDFILDDFNRARETIFNDPSIGGMVVCDSSEQARELERQLEERRKKGETETSSALILHDESDKEERSQKVDAYKAGKIDLIIVYSMLLTGFDAPRLKRLYLGRKIKAHNLLQTLTRVNRPYKNYGFGYVVDFADITYEFDKTNKAYLEELNSEYEEALTEDDEDNVFGSIFVSADEIQAELTNSSTVLLDLPTQNKEYFAQELEDISDRKKLREIKKALESMREFYNMARLMGHKELIEQINISEVSTLLNIVSRRMIMLSLLEKPSDFSSQQLLNLAMSETAFTFTKIGEEELRLAANDLEEIRIRTGNEINNLQNENDPEWVDLSEELRRILKKHSIRFQDDVSIEDINNLKKEYSDLYAKAQEYKKSMNSLIRNFDGDDMAARSFKQATKSMKVSEFPAVYEVIKGAKIQLDQKISLNQNVRSNEEFLEKMIREAARQEMKKSELTKELKRDEFIKLVESILNEYEREYQN